MRKGLAAIAAVYLRLGVFYAFSDSRSGTGGAPAGMRQYPDVHPVCGPDGVAPGCRRQPDPDLLTWNKQPAPNADRLRRVASNLPPRSLVAS